MTLIRILSCLTFLITAATAAPKNITDYFLAIPNQAFTEGSPAELLKIIKRGEDGSVLDTKNGYMRLSGDGAQVSLQVALFRFADKSPLLAVAWGNLEEPDFTHVTFFRERGGRMEKADRSILPAIDSGSHRFELPRLGRTVIIRNAGGEILLKYTWDGTQFRKE